MYTPDAILYTAKLKLVINLSHISNVYSLYITHPHWNTTHDHIQPIASSPNSNKLSIANRYYITHSSTFTNSGMRVIHIGTYMQPVTLPKTV